MLNPTQYSACDLVDMVLKKDISPTELLESHLLRFRSLNPELNAVVYTQIDKAKKRAKKLEALLMRGEALGALYGLPMTIKESYDWVGSPSTWGLPELRNNFPISDSEIVRRLEQSGAIIYGKTNVPARLADWQTFNGFYGTTNNPWNLSYSPGGSSGGSAVSIAVGMASLDVGSDIGGSIRNPAHYCGIFGHKPSSGIIPMDGHQLPERNVPFDMLVGGPLARTSKDLALGFNVLTGATNRIEQAPPLETSRHGARKLRDFKVGVMPTSTICAQDDELTNQLDSVIVSLCKNGLKVDRNPNIGFDLKMAHHTYLLLLRSATTCFLTEEEFQEHIRRARVADLDSTNYRSYVDHGVALYHRDWQKLDNTRRDIEKAWETYFESCDLLLCPAAASAAVPHDHVGDRSDRLLLINGTQEPVVDQLFWAGLANCSYLPATVVPVGLTASGLPCGLQIIGGYGNDDLTLEFAGIIEREIGGYRTPES